MDPQKATQAYQTADFNSYGTTEIDIIVDRFKVSVKQETLQSEWMTLKHVLVHDFNTTNHVMQALASDETLSSLYPSLRSYRALLLFYLCRQRTVKGVLTLKRIRTAPRNRLKTQTLDKLIRISSEGPEPTDFNFDHAATVWASKIHRKIQF